MPIAASVTGQVRIAWKRTDNGGAPKIRLAWRETGGPAVTIPTRKGFGSLLIEASFAAEGETAISSPGA
jgi:two-component sensor histidine kinase